MRVLYVNHTLQKSGAGISLGTLVRHLSPQIEPHFVLRKGSDVRDTVGARDKPVYFERFMPQFMTMPCSPQYSVPLLAWHWAKSANALRTMRRLVRRWGIDVIHLNESVLIPYVFVARTLGVPVVMHARGATADRPVEQWLLSRAGRLRRFAIIAIDTETAESMPPQARHLTHVIHNPIELGAPADAGRIAALRRSWGCAPGDVVIGQAASLHTSKGIWDILEIAAVVCSKHPRARFVLPGDDSPEAGEGPALREAIAARGLRDRVVLPGYVTDLAAAYGAIDIGLCLFSEYLGCVGRPAYEAGLAGKPVVVTLPRPGQSDTIENGVTGLVLEPGDRTGVIDAIGRLVVSEDERHRLGERAQVHLAERHRPARVAAACEQLYRAVLQDETRVQA